MPGELADVFPGIDIPQLDAEISTAAHDRISSHLNSVHGAGMPTELLEHGAGFPSPNADADVFGAGDYIAVVECEVEDCGRVVSEAHYGGVVVIDVVDYTGSIRRTSDQDILVVLETED